MPNNNDSVWIRHPELEERLLALRDDLEKTYQEIADILTEDLPDEDFSSNQVRKKYNRLQSAEEESEDENILEIEDDVSLSVNWETGEITGKRLGSPVTKEQLMEAAGLREDEWKIVWATSNSWPTTMKGEKTAKWTTPERPGGTGTSHVKWDAIQVRNFQLKIKVEPIQEMRTLREAMAPLLEQIREEIKGSYEHKIYTSSSMDDPKMYEIALFDPHFAKLAWGLETGQDQDLKLTEAVFREASAQLLARVENSQVERFLLPLGQDFFHIDVLINGTGGSTSAGTPQDVDSRWQKAFMVGRQVTTDLLLRLLEQAPVDVLVVPGNHDEQRAWYLGEVLDARFHDNPHIRFDNRPVTRKYYRYFQALLGFTHGKDEKKKDLPGLMSQEAREDWGHTLFREWHLGHLHKEWERSDEAFGVRQRIIPSLSSTDAWHSRKGFVQNIRGARGFLWTRDRGLDSVNHYNIPPTPMELERVGPLLGQIEESPNRGVMFRGS